jgi:DNA replication protein DnaD
MWKSVEANSQTKRISSTLPKTKKTTLKLLSKYGLVSLSLSKLVHIHRLIQDKNKEISRYIHEIQLLTNRNTQMSDEIEALGEEMQLALKELQR